MKTESVLPSLTTWGPGGGMGEPGRKPLGQRGPLTHVPWGWGFQVPWGTKSRLGDPWRPHPKKPALVQVWHPQGCSPSVALGVTRLGPSHALLAREAGEAGRSICSYFSLHQKCEDDTCQPPAQ